MSAEVELLKKLVSNDQVVSAVELPAKSKGRPLVVDDIEDVLSRFDTDDMDYAHFVVRVKRSKQPLPRPEAEEHDPQISLDSMLSETLELTEKLAAAHSDPNAPSSAAPTAPEGEYDPAFLLENAKLLEESGDFELARNIYQALVRKGAFIPQGLSGMARTYERQGNDAKAIRCYQEAIAYSSEYPFYQSLAAIQIRTGDDEEASRTLLHALGLPLLDDEKKFELHKSLGNCFTRLSDYPKAEHHYRKAYELNAQSDSLQVNVGSLALQKGDHDSAEKHFERALELNAKNDRAISGLGMVYLARNNPQRAHDQFVASLRLNLNNVGAIYNLVKCAYELKKFDDAARILKAYIETSPANTNILYSYAGILYHQGNFAQAMAEVKKIVESNPAHAGAKELMALIQARL